MIRMLRFLADENFHGAVVRGLARKRSDLDIARAQDVGLTGVADDELLSWAAEQGRLVLTHDASTLTAYAWKRVREGLRMPGVVEVGQDVSLGQAISDLLLLAEASVEGEWEGQILYLPL